MYLKGTKNTITPQMYFKDTKNNPHVVEGHQVLLVSLKYMWYIYKLFS